MLSDNDRQRIEQAAKLSWKNTITAFEDSDEISFWEGYLTGAEYATLYERESWTKQCEILITQRNEMTELSKKEINRLEAERSELRNKVIEECIGRILEDIPDGCFEDDVVFSGLWIKSILNSLKK